jgi:hypothetical protein
MPVENFEIENNGRRIVVERQKIKKGPNVGAEVNRPDVFKLDWDTLVDFFGKELLLTAVVRPTLSRIALGIDKQVSEIAEGDPAKYQDMYRKKFIELDSMGESLSVLKEQRDDLFNEMASLDEPKYEIDKATGVITFGTDPDSQKYLRLSLDVRKLNDTIAEKEKEAEKRRAEREARKANEPQAVAA